MYLQSLINGIFHLCALSDLPNRSLNKCSKAVGCWTMYFDKYVNRTLVY